MSYEYPGNIRELENIAQRILIACEGDVVEPQHIASVFGETEWLTIRDNRQES